MGTQSRATPECRETGRSTGRGQDRKSGARSGNNVAVEFLGLILDLVLWSWLLDEDEGVRWFVAVVVIGVLLGVALILLYLWR